MREILKTADALICPDALMETAGQVAGHHRIQASPGFRQAAQYCQRRLEEYGIQAELVSYPADGRHTSATNRTLREWSISSAACQIDGFGPIADYASAPLSVIVRSVACDFRRDGLEVVYLDKSSCMADYEDTDLAGRLAFVRGNINDFAWAVTQKGARGLITDFVLHPDTQQDVIRYTSFWWKEEPQEVKYFGFALPPALGKRLAEFCLRAREENRPVVARGHVDSQLYDGTLDLVSAFIPGDTAQEVWITAHLCHPQTSANDNASGVAAGIGAMAAIRQALASGAIKPLRRGVRLLLIPEMAGTVEYLAHLGDGAGQVVAGINLDMVGGRQDPGYGPLVLTSLPRSTPSFTEYAAMLALEGAAGGYRGFNPGQPLPSVSHAVSVFSGGSDHYILSDPTIGIPTTMLGQWPDKYYHTSGDTMDRLSPQVLKASCATAFAFAVRISCLKPKHLAELFARGKSRFARELESLCDDIRHRQPQEGWVSEAFAHYLDTYQAAFGDALKFFPGDSTVAALVDAEKNALHGLASAFLPAYLQGGVGPEDDSPGDRRVPRRLYSMPCAAPDLAAQAAGQPELWQQYKKGPGQQMTGEMETLTEYYMDGARTIGQISRLVAIDTGRDAGAARDYIQALHGLGLVQL